MGNDSVIQKNYIEIFGRLRFYLEQNFDPFVVSIQLRKFAGWIMILLIIQLIYGAFMAGLKAASFAPTWPTINGSWGLSNIHSLGNREFAGLSFLTDNPLVIHFIHRNLAYIISVLIFIWWWKSHKVLGSKLFRKINFLPLFIVLLQVLLGILTVINTSNTNLFLWLGLAHQCTAMLLLLSLVCVRYIVRGKPVTGSL